MGTTPPAANNTLARVRASCAAAVAASAGDVDAPCVERAGCLALALELLRAPPAAQASQWRLPLRFASVGEEVNALVLLQLLNIGSGFRRELHEATGAGAWDTMTRGLLTLHLTGKRLSASFLAGFGLGDVEDTFGFSPDAEVAVMPGVYERRAGPLRPLAVHIVAAMNEAGHALLNRQLDDFHSFIVAGAAAEARAAGAAAADGASVPWRPSAAAFVGRLADAFPPFRDVATISDPAAAAAALPPPLEVWTLKKAQLAASHLHRRFGSEHPGLFDFHDVADLTVMADNVLPAVMRHFGAIVLPPALAADIDAGTPLPRGRSEALLRAAAVVAGEVVAREVRQLAAAALAGPAAVEALVTRAGRPLTADKAAAVLAAAAAAAAPAEGAATNAAAAAAGPPARRLAGLTEAELDELLWVKGKEPALRALQRHATKDTYFY